MIRLVYYMLVKVNIIKIITEDMVMLMYIPPSDSMSYEETDVEIKPD